MFNFELSINKMYFKIIVASLLCLFTATFVGCKKDQRPSDVLSKQEMSAIMVDIYLSEARLNSLPLVRDSSLKLFLPKEAAILAKWKVSDTVLKKSYAYYLERPDDFNEVYDIIIDSLTVMEKRKADQNLIK